MLKEIISHERRIDKFMGDAVMAVFKGDYHLDRAIDAALGVQAAIKATGDDTIRSSVMDIARRLEWPERYGARVLKNDFTERWHDNVASLLENQDVEADKWRDAWTKGDVDVANTFVGEGVGMINTVEPAAVILHRMVEEAETHLARF